MLDTIRDRAIILNKKQFGEADYLLTLLTENHGKIKAVAKGIRRPSSRSVGHAELFSILSAQINIRSKIPIVSQIVVENSIAGLAEDPFLLSRISLLAEIVDKALEEGEVHEAVFGALTNGMTMLRQGYKSAVFIGVLVRLLGLLGYAPELTHCTVCREKLVADDKYGFNHDLGGVVAGDCIGQTPVLSETLSGDQLKALRYVQRQPLDGMALLQIPESVNGELDRLLLDYVHYVLERPILSARFALAY